MKSKKVSPETGRLNELMFEMGRMLKQQMTADGYGPSSYLHIELLRYLTGEAEADMRDVARYLRVSAPSATGLVDTLVREKLVARKPDPKDRRRVLITVSPKGRAAIARAAKHREAAFARVAEPLSSADRAELIRILTIITENA
jgi:DNA-binding MarR family transcriptional regulator